MPTRGHAAPLASLQSWAHASHDSPGSHTPLPQQVPPSQQAPQSASQVPHVSPCEQVPSPQPGLLVDVVVSPPAPPVGIDVVTPPEPPEPPLDVVELDEEPPSPQPETKARHVTRGPTRARARDRRAAGKGLRRGERGCITRPILKDFGAER